MNKSPTPRQLAAVPEFKGRKPLVIEDSEITPRGIVNALVKGDVSPDKATNLIQRLIEYHAGNGKGEHS